MTAADDRSTDLLTELAEAEAAEADAREEADRAKARAAELAVLGDVEAPATVRSRLRSGRAAGLASVAVLVGAGVTAIVLMVVNHVEVAAQRAQDRAAVDAARNGVTALLSIDHTRARQDVQRVLDLSTGRFRDEFARDADDFVATAVESKAVTVGSVNAAALQAVRDGDGVVMVAANSTVSNAGGARDDLRPWRMSVTVTRDGDTWKMSDVEFVP